MTSSSPTMTPRDRRALTAGVIVVVSLAALARGLPAWRAWQRDAHAAAAAATANLARAKLLARVQKPLADSLAARGKRLVSLAPALVEGDTPASAGATLAGLVSGAAALANVRLGAVQIHADTAAAGAFTRISVRADATGDVRGLAHLLGALERGPALLAVRTLDVAQPEPAAGADRAEALRITLTVDGLMLTPTPRSATKSATKPAHAR